MKKLTRKEMLTRLIDDQIAKGIGTEADRENQIKWRLKGFAGCKPMSWSECYSWYTKVFGE